jgi:shikimate kinase
MNKSILNNNFLRRPIVLIGMMGAGKTSVGRALAGLLSLPFLDSDSEIEAAAGCSVTEIFTRYGEAEFRRVEQQVIARLLDGSICVLSVGGGAFMDAQTRGIIKDKAFSVWLKVDQETLLNRVQRHGLRPLLAGRNPEEKLNKLLSERAPVYAQADLTVFCDDRPVSHNAHQIMLSIQGALGLQNR